MNAIISPKIASWTWVVAEEDYSVDRLDKSLTNALANELGEWTQVQRNLSRSQIQTLIRSNAFLINGNPQKPKYQLKISDRVELFLPPATIIDLSPEDGPLEILFEDDEIAVINKPQNLTVHPSETQKSQTLVNRLLFHLKSLGQIGSTIRPGIVHRLDKNTSGAMVISKSDKAHQSLSKQFANHSIVREYHALVYGECKAWSDFRVETFIDRHPKDRKKMAVSEKAGKRAITDLTALKWYADKSTFATLVQAQLHTGRTHQVRVHLSHLGYGIFGDPTYGKSKKVPDEIQKLISLLPGQALHARVLEFDHPSTGKRLRFEASPPENFSQLLNTLEKYLYDQK